MKKEPIRCLIIESLHYHWEVIESWVHMLRDIGVDVEIATGENSGHRETISLLGLSPEKIHSIDQLDNLPAEQYDFILLNTLVHEGYFFRPSPQHRPNLGLLQRLNRPSVCVIHEPVQWIEKSIQHAFIENDHGTEKILHLLADGTSLRDDGFWSTENWTLDENILTVPSDGTMRSYHSPDNGQTFQCITDKEISLVRREMPEENLHAHLSSGKHIAITLTAEGAKKLNTVYSGIEWILPFRFQERDPSRASGPIAFAGTIDYDRKAIPSLLSAAASLPPGEQILIIGGSRSDDFDNDRFVQTFKRQIKEHQLEDKFLFTGYLSYGSFLKEIKKCRFIIPLIDDYVDSGAYLVKLPASVPLSLGLGIPMILSDTVPARCSSDSYISFHGSDLKTGLDICRKMTEESYEQLLQHLDNDAKLLYAANLSKLKMMIEKITAKKMDFDIDLGKTENSLLQD